MASEFEIHKEIELEATPEQVWEAIATGPGIDSWFMGPHEVEPREGGAIKLAIPGSPEVGTVTGWDPPHRFAHRSIPGEDGSFHAFEFLVEGRDGGTCVLRFVHSGRAGDDWSDEFEAMTGHGWDMYLFTLSEYVKYFPGRFATYITANGPQASAEKEAWPVLERGLGLTGPVSQGDHIRLTPGGFDPIEGVVDYVEPGHFIGVRADDAMYRFHGLSLIGMPIAAGHHIFREIDPVATAQAWETWMHRLFPASE
jgi:uncharacterized protein YndB with AHSA1/START domain